MRDPSISVVTACLNAAGSLKHCIESVEGQKGVKVEHIVIDGGSSDGSLEILRSFPENSLIWKSERDDGIADAMNKGARLANGDWLIFLQADDRLLHDEVLSHAMASTSLETDILVGGIQLPRGPRLYAPAGKVIRGWPIRTAFKMPFCHQGMLISAHAWERMGEFDCGYRITMDYDWVLRAYWQGLSVTRIGLPIAEFGTKGLSSSREWRLKQARFREENRAREKNAPNGAWRLLYQLFWLMYYPCKRMGG